MSAEINNPVSVDPYLRGAVRLVRRSDGLTTPSRFFSKQARTLASLGRGHRAQATAGIAIDFVTTGDEVSFDCEVLGKIDPYSRMYEETMALAPEGAVAEAGVMDSIDVVVEGHGRYLVPVHSGRIEVPFENPWGQACEVRIVLPCMMSVAVGNLMTNGSLEPAPERDYLLVLGDSIFQGFTAGRPSMTIAAQLAHGMDLDLVNQAVAGYIFDESTLRGIGQLRERPPACIVVAYGTNDWGRVGSASALRNAARAYLERLNRAFPEVPTYVVSPLWRADKDEPSPSGKRLGWMHKMLRHACEGLKNMHVIRGFDLLPHNAAFMADGRLHPNADGCTIVAERLLAAIAKSRARERANALAALCDDVDVETQLRDGSPGAHPEFERLVRTIWRLRQPDGCPWDREQTHESMAAHLIEEAYEASEAAHVPGAAHLAEELGDVLEQVLLHAQIADDEGSFDIDDICRALNEKLVRRHPHVFGNDGVSASTADEVLGVWNQVKQQERADAGEAGLLDSIPVSLPALLQCQKVSKRAAAAGFEWDTVEDVWDQVASERAEMEAEELGTPERAMEFGDMLFALVNVARREGIDAEEALAGAVRKFRRRWSDVERLAAEQGRDVESFSTAELNELWGQVKLGERTEVARPVGKQEE